MDNPDPQRQPLWKRVLLSPLYLLRLVWGLLELAEGIYFLILALAVFVVLAFLSLTTIRDVIL